LNAVHVVSAVRDADADRAFNLQTIFIFSKK
jgi:hypothetical protein